MKVLLIDAYDSFLHIIDHYLRQQGAETEVVRSRTRTPAELAAARPDALVLGPGPGHPADSGHVELVRRFAGRVPILGVCLGHQAIGLAYGGRIETAARTVHGKTSRIDHDSTGVFAGLPDGAEVTRYHSLAVSEPLPDGLTVTARAREDGCVMGLRHRELPVEGVQFHPESITTQHGLRFIDNFLGGTKRWTETATVPATGRR
ncbi:aminodeoxychorismate/anthranilate synthase component II [Streptomyces sp. ISL-98]|uniref:anthranilate synthase component II n=1 Tax=Streptomyces sp. ISL-98 TaxID=2819192 RepID=UPI001BE9A34B|nr:aminodeoxychorismate/anthranilate synthase component II [Streptomyces sp. ISL-98]MBT2510075.1 aminodeoxychorismate/anthranilate synthase component II [Streptomyces sp. ISL-98]